MDAHTLELLEFGKVRELVAGYAASALGKERARSLAPLTDLPAAELAIAYTTEMVEALEVRLPPPLGGLRDVRAEVKRAGLGMILEIDQLTEIRDVLDLTGHVFEYALRLAGQFPHLEALLAGVQDLRHVSRAIDAAIDLQGKIKDSASPELAQVRRELAEYDERIQHEIRRLLRSPQIQKALRYQGSTVNNDHHVLPIAVNYRHAVAGVVHRTSATGETVYIEPARVAELSAEVAVLKNTEMREIRKVLRRLSDLVRNDCATLLAILEILGELDFIYAKARISRDYQMTAPEVIAKGRLLLQDARHPLLEHLFRQEQTPHPNPLPKGERESMKTSNPLPKGEREPDEKHREVVPITVHLGGEFDLLIITGPNTGGKTVALKTIGLLSLMALSGMHVPAKRGAQVPLLDDVLADIGDEQSIEQSLSTFSSHISRINDILRRCSPNSLVLLDELGAGTEPSEGAALGRAILDELVVRGCRAMVTTHLNDLKTYALSAPRAENAAMEFDANTLRPTYRLHIGQFGQSCALKIARRLNLPRPLLSRAYHYLRKRRGRQTAELAQLQEMRAEAEQARRQALDAEESAKEAAVEFRRKSDQLKQEVEVQQALETARAALKPGDRVRVPRLDKDGKVVRVDHRRRLASVAVGAVAWEMKLDDLVPLTSVGSMMNRLTNV